MELDNKQFLLTALTPTELQKLIRESVSAELSVFALNFSKKKNDDCIASPITDGDAGEQLLIKKEVCKFLSISYPTLRDWLRNGKIIGYEFNNKTYFKKSEILSKFEEIVSSNKFKSKSSTKAKVK